MAVSDEFQRKFWKDFRDGKTICGKCDDTTFSKDGFAKHLAAKHGLRGSVAVEECWREGRGKLRAAMLLETDNMLERFNHENKEKFPEMFEVSCDLLEVRKSLHAATAELSVKMFGLYLDAADCLKEISSDATVVRCQSTEFLHSFNLWKSVGGGYVAKCIWTKARTQTVIPAPQVSHQLQQMSIAEASSEVDPVVATLKRIFGFDSFRPGQREVIDIILGGRSGLAMMATSAGKTLCFLLPAVLSDGVTVAIFPTLSLITDMYHRFQEVCNVAMVTGDTTMEEKDRVFSSIATDQSPIKLLLTTPESLVDSVFLAALAKAHTLRFIVDEAHCVDRWGHQFRPKYLELKSCFARFDSCQVVALTGTATEKTKMSIIANLGLQDPFVQRMSFSRPNLKFQVVQKPSTVKARQYVLALLNGNYAGTSCIVYCMTPSECNNLCDYLLANDVSCVAYHGMLEPFEKVTNQGKWQNNAVKVIVATKALGMGIDKPDVRLVLHYTMPGSIDDYYQEAGRAGRDGLPSDCILMYKMEDRSIHIDHILKLDDNIQQNSFLNELLQVTAFCADVKCRQAFLLAYYSETSISDCGHCDMCTLSEEAVTTNYTTDAQNCVLLLQGLSTVIGQVSFGILVKVFKGSKEKEILKQNLNNIPLYGCGKKFTMKDAASFIMYLICRKVLHENISVGKRSTFLSPGVNSPSLLKNQMDINACIRL